MLNYQKSFEERMISFYESRILVIDASLLNRELIINYLEHAGFKNLEIVTNYEDVLSVTRHFIPDIIILDLMTPEDEGLKLIHTLRESMKIQHVPILVQISSEDPEQRIKAWQAGASDVIAKPIHRLEILSRIKVQLENGLLLQELENYHALAQADIDQALEVQKALLPSSEMVSDLALRYNVKIDSLFTPSHFLSGDIWGALDISPHQLAIWICDFSGKGIQAALHTFRLHTLIQEFKHCADAPLEMIDALNNRLVKVMPVGQFSTFLFGVIDFQEDLFTYTSASAPHPLIYFPQEKRFMIGEGTGVPLGIVERQSYRLETMSFPKGSSLILYSDLLWEAKAVPGICLESSNLEEFARELNGQSLVHTTRQQLSLLGNPSFVDDLTLIEVARHI